VLFKDFERGKREAACEFIYGTDYSGLNARWLSIFLESVLAVAPLIFDKVYMKTRDGLVWLPVLP